MGTSFRILLWCSAILLAEAGLGAGGRAEAHDRDKRELFNTFQLPGAGGSYLLTLRQDRTFSLQGPCGTAICGQFNASGREIGLWYANAHRHFRYATDGCTLTLEPTSKDTPCPRDLLGGMPPARRGAQAVFHTGSVARAPVQHYEREQPDSAVPTVALYRPRPSPYEQRGHYETRTETVLVEAARCERRWVPAVYETRCDRWGRHYSVLVSAAHFETVQLPARYETRQMQVWVAGR